jgi:uncharacterized protein YxjI
MDMAWKSLSACVKGSSSPLLHSSGDSSATVKRTYWPWITSDVSVSIDDHEIQIVGSFFAHEFSFTRNGREVAKVSKKFWSWTDSYGLEVESSSYDVFFIGIVGLLDFWYSRNESLSYGD